MRDTNQNSILGGVVWTYIHTEITNDVLTIWMSSKDRRILSYLISSVEFSSMTTFVSFEELNRFHIPLSLIIRVAFPSGKSKRNLFVTMTQNEIKFNNAYIKSIWKISTRCNWLITEAPATTI